MTDDKWRKFQDTSTLQYDIARCLASGSGHLTIVGDPDQSSECSRFASKHRLTESDKQSTDGDRQTFKICTR